jgi:hypothetical protein
MLFSLESVFDFSKTKVNPKNIILTLFAESGCFSPLKAFYSDCNVHKPPQIAKI